MLNQFKKSVIYKEAESDARKFYYQRLKGNSKLMAFFFPFYILKACFKLAIIMWGGGGGWKRFVDFNWCRVSGN
ncbi:MAG: hypothetical protein LBB45_03665 [Methanobrevibacter sp.]|jgi:hypothetical protein|nr:hypothetical protein [Candidatus Methanovirga basalitermitum]